MSGHWPFDREAIGAEQVGEAVGDGAAFAGAAGDGDQLLGGGEQTPAIHSASQTVGNWSIGVHDEII
jgi:hypothetical protein